MSQMFSSVTYSVIDFIIAACAMSFSKRLVEAPGPSPRAPTPNIYLQFQNIKKQAL